jgi:hypothetical protein
MKSKPYPTDPEGASSRFVGSFVRRPDQTEVGLSLTLPINGKTYRVQWRPENLKPGLSPVGDPGMPQAVTWLPSRSSWSLSARLPERQTLSESREHAGQDR